MIRKSYIVLLVLSSFFSSCSREMGEETDPNAPVGLDARIAGVSLITRGGATEDASNISSLGIYAVNKVSTETTYGQAPIGTYCAYKIESGTASPNDANAPLWLCLDKAIIFSCHPAPVAPVSITSDGASADPNPVVTIPAAVIGLSQTNIAKEDNNIYDFADAAHDYMYGVAYDDAKSNAAKFLTTQPVADNGHTTAGNVVNSSGPTVAIGLKHAFAQIKLIISKGDYQGDTKITKVEYTRKMKTLASEGTTTMSLKDGALNNTAELADKTYLFGFAADGVVPSTVSADKSTPVTLINYVLPNEAPATSSKSKFAITVDGKTMTMDHVNDPEWEAGNIYAYMITINGTGLALTGFTVVGWENDSQPDIPTI